MPVSRFAALLLSVLVAALITVGLAVWAAPALPGWALPVAGVVAMAACLAVARR